MSDELELVECEGGTRLCLKENHDEDHVERIELTIIHKEAVPDVWTRLGLWPDEDEEDEELECNDGPVPNR